MIACAVGVRESDASVIESTEDMRVEISVSVTSSQHATGVRYCLRGDCKSRGCSTTGCHRHTNRNAPATACRYQSAIRDIHRKSRGIKLRLGKSFRRQPVEIARPVGDEPVMFPATICACPFILFWLGGAGWKVRPVDWQFPANVSAARRTMRFRKRASLGIPLDIGGSVSSDQSAPRCLYWDSPSSSGWIAKVSVSSCCGSQINHDCVRQDGFLAGDKFSVPLHHMVTALHACKPCQRRRITGDQIRVLRHVVHDLTPNFSNDRAISGLMGGELDQVQSAAAKAPRACVRSGLPVNA